MKLLFITQKVDKSDDLLGIYHEWIKKLASEFEFVHVICLYKGEYDLPFNVKVHSLGKEEYFRKRCDLGGGACDGKRSFLEEKIFSRVKYVVRFYKYTWLLRKEYDSVFVHMNPEYLILAGPIWRLLGKKVVLWYAHFLDSLKLRIAVFFINKVVTSVKEAFPFNTRKLVVLQQGIDIHRFTPKESGISEDGKIDILFVGRISPVKNLDTLIKAFGLLIKKHHNLHLNIIGGPTEKDMDYFQKIKNMVSELEIEKNVSFLGKVPNDKTPEIYNDNDIFVNLTKTGSFDKTTLEAMASGLVVLVSNSAFDNIFSADLREKLMFKERDTIDLVSKIENLINIPKEDISIIKKNMRDIIVKKHSLESLMEKLSYVLKE
ncbi:MAG: glycosyltransferase family 4 protein [Parcubacteria group bacterium]|nr:glycosyltransferase family 4 protein [Parcubacteria group bacterium]MCR4342508.1 glycosyltransferase family 4 protein [Patescibacteria group bacterium]